MINREPWIAIGDAHTTAQVAPGLQGRILCLDTAGPLRGTPAGYINNGAVDSGETNDPFHNYGGVDRLWIGPEGGVHGFFFITDDAGRSVWRTPHDLNTGAFAVCERNASSVHMRRTLSLQNKAGTDFCMHVDRIARTSSAAELVALKRAIRDAGVPDVERISVAGVVSETTVTNGGPEAWRAGSGLPCIWILGQFVASPAVRVWVPLRDAAFAKPTPYFGSFPPGFISKHDRLLEARCDGRRRAKFGIPPACTTGYAAAGEPGAGRILCIQFDVAPVATPYVHNNWEQKVDAERNGDVFQCYNSDDGSYFELESASPALQLTPGASACHVHRTFLLLGPELLLAGFRDRLPEFQRTP